MGNGMNLDQVENELRGRAMDFVGLGALVKFDFGADGALFLDGRKTPPTVSRDGADPETTLKISLADFKKLGEGKLNPMFAFTTGKLKIGGNMGVALKLANMMED